MLYLDHQHALKGGYIEVPNGIIETIKPFDSHLWFVFLNKNKLIFIRKTKQIHEILLENGLKYDEVLGKIREPFIRIYWKKKVDYQIIDDFKPDEKFISKTGSAKGHATKKPNPYILLMEFLRMLFYKEKSEEALQKTLKKPRKFR